MKARVVKTVSLFWVVDENDHLIPKTVKVKGNEKTSFCFDNEKEAKAWASEVNKEEVQQKIKDLYE